MAELTIKVKAATEEAQKAFKDMVKNIDGISKQVEEFSSRGSIAMSSFIGNFASTQTIRALDLLKDGLHEVFFGSIREAAEAQQVVHDFANSLKLTGQFSENSVKDFEEYAKEVQKTTKYTDDAIIKNAAYIESLTGLNEKGLKRVSDASVQLASVLGIDLRSAGEMLVKAFNGSTTTLERAGVRFQKTGDDAKDFETILKTIEDRWGGKAQSDLNTYSGRVTQLGKAFGELQEAVGKSLVNSDKVNGFYSFLAETMFNLADAISEASDASDRMNKNMGKLYETQYGGNRQTNRPSLDVPEINQLLDEVTGQLTTPEKAKPEFLTQSQIAAIEKASEAEKKRQESIKKFTIETAELGLQGVSRIEEEKKKKLNELVEAYGGQKKVQELNAEEAASFSSNQHKITMEYLEKEAKFKKETSEKEEKLKHDIFEREKKRAEDIRKIREEQQKNLDEAVTKGSQGIFSKIKTPYFENNKQVEQFKDRVNTGRALGVGAQVLNGEAGARNLLTSGISAIPVYGQALAPIVDALSRGPDYVKSMIKQFMEAVPMLISNIVEATPAVFDAIIEQLPRMIDSLISSVPRLVDSLVKALPRMVEELSRNIPTIINSFIEHMPEIIISFQLMMPQIAVTFMESLVKNIPYLVSNIAVALYNAVVDIFNKLNPFSGDSAVGGFFDSLGFAEGGYVKKVPGGFPNDSFPARLTQGEFVIDQSTSKKLDNFLNGQTDNSGVLNQILALLNSPMSVETSVQVNQQTFANIILELSRQNRRLSA